MTNPTPRASDARVPTERISDERLHLIIDCAKYPPLSDAYLREVLAALIELRERRATPHPVGDAGERCPFRAREPRGASRLGER